MADYGLLMTSATAGELHSGQAQTTQHILAAFAMGLSRFVLGNSLHPPLPKKGISIGLNRALIRLVVAINKLDGYRDISLDPQKQFQLAKELIAGRAIECGYKPEQITFVPICAYFGKFQPSWKKAFH